MSERIRRAGQVAWDLVGLAAVVALVGGAAWALRIIWPPLILAGAIVFVLHPVVTALHRRGIPRVLGTALTYLGIILGLVLVGLLMTPLVSHQSDQLSDEWPKIRRDVER